MEVLDLREVSMEEATLKDVLAHRYASKSMRAIWAPEAKIIRERRLWLAVLRAQIASGLEIYSADLARYEKVLENVDLKSIERRERESRHDVKARIEEFNALAGAQSIHLGMTSRDLTELVEAAQVKDSLRLVLKGSVALLHLLALKADEFKDLAIVGRSHNVPAQITTLGKRFATIIEEALFAVARVEDLIERLPLRGLRGPVGTAQDMTDLIGVQSHKEVEDALAQELGFEKVMDSTGQIYPRSFDFDVISALVQLGAGPSNFATSIRLMAGAGLLSEGFKAGQVGSSAMPHKVNARSSERINGLMVVLRGHLSMISEISGDQWNEGDVSCSVVRRVAIPGAFFALDGMLQTSATIVNEMTIFHGRIEREVREQLPFLATTRLLTEAVKKGMGREDAHKVIQKYSLHAIEAINRGEESNFLLSLGQDSSFPLTPDEISALTSNASTFIGDAPAQVSRVISRVKELATKHRTLDQVDFEEII